MNLEQVHQLLSVKPQVATEAKKGQNTIDIKCDIKKTCFFLPCGNFSNRLMQAT